MEPPGTNDDDVVQSLERTIVEALPDADGPVHVLGSQPISSGATDYEVSATRLIPLDPEDPAVADVYVPVPVTGHVSLAPDGTMRADLAAVDEAVSREVRAWARALVANGSVAGLAASGPSYGPPRRPTHGLVTDANGRRVLRRTGYVLS